MAETKRNDYRWSDESEPNKAFRSKAETEKYLANYRKNMQKLMKEASPKKKKSK